MISKKNFLSFAHVNQEVIKEKLAYTEVSFDSDIGWLKYFVSETPNGVLFQKNILYDIVCSQKVYLAHITTNLPAIQAEGRLLSSSGCLVGSIYSTPVIQEGENFRLHNLGEYILLKEAPAFSKNKNVCPLLVELEFSHPAIRPAVGVDYLKLGQVHFDIFSELSYLLSHHELEELNLSTINSIRKISNLLIVVGKHSPESILKNFGKFYELYLCAISDSPILGYILFEVCPNVTTSFNLGLFRPELSRIKSYIATMAISSNDKLSFEQFLAKRLHYLISGRFYRTDSDENLKKSFWENIEWNLPYLQHQLAPLLGHTIHRFLRNMKRYPNFYFYFDQYKALQVWNYWNQASIALPYNAILPKGEIGINPANPYMKYSVYTAKSYQKDGLTYLTKDKKIQITIEPRLTELNMSSMRKKI